MNKLIPVLIFAGMAVMLMISWSTVLSYEDTVSKEYEQHISAAETYLDKEILIDAVAELEKALQLKPNDYDLAVRIAKLYDEMGNEKAYIDAYQNAIFADKEQLEPYLIIADYQLGISNFRQAFQVLKQAEEVFPGNAEITNRIIGIKSQYSLFNYSFDSMKRLYYGEKAKNGYAVVSIGEKYGLMSADYRLIMGCEYDYIGLPGNEVIPIKKNGEYYFIDMNGYRKLVPERALQSLGSFGNGYAPICIDDVYGYLDTDMQECHLEYSFTGGFANGLAAVQKDGKWAVINTQFSPVVPFEFDEIVMDEYGYCSAFKVFFAKKDGKFFLYDATGKQLSEGFDEAKPFVSQQPAAVRVGDRWGFVSKDGSLSIEPSYADADSFCVGYAPFFQNGKWGCIDQKGNVLIEPTFEKMAAFDRTGRAKVEKDGLIRHLLINIYE